MDALVTTAWLADQLGASDLRVADCTWFLPGEGRDARGEYDAAHIPGAVFLDLAELVDEANPAPMMMPPPEKFASRLAKLGIGDGCRVVLYDASPHHTAARAWAMFRSFGIPDVAILDGGLSKWRSEDRPLTAEPIAPRPRHLTPREHGNGIVAQPEVARALEDGTQVVDARSPARFAGEEPEPRAGVVPGHMPGAINLHYARLFNPDGTYKRGDELRTVLAEAGVDPDRPIVATCGSGVTAATLAFALHLLGREVPIYDGSWGEWGADPATPKATGRA
jgi:thiosulfate/3-mercaptopyruvate sulfurtransferase